VNLNEDYRRYNIQALANICRNIKFPVNLQPLSTEKQLVKFLDGEFQITQVDREVVPFLIWL